MAGGNVSIAVKYCEKVQPSEILNHESCTFIIGITVEIF